MVELASLIDPSLSAPPYVPNTVFTGVQLAGYWSATTWAGEPLKAWVVNFGNGGLRITDKESLLYAWCVRGGMNADAY